MKSFLSKLNILCCSACFVLLACGDDSSSSAPEETSSANGEESCSSVADFVSSSSSSALLDQNSSSSETVPESSQEALSSVSEPEKSAVDISFGSFTDERDGRSYKTVSIDSQTWMAENLNYEYQGDSAVVLCYENKAENCDKYGRLYDWKTALNVCPEGWHLPTYQDFEVVVKMVDPTVKYDEDWDELHSMNASGFLKTSSGWNGSDDYGFNALPAGGFDSWKNEFYGLGEGTVFWASAEAKSDRAYSLYLNDNDQMGVGGFAKNWARSVRCIKDAD